MIEQNIMKERLKEEKNKLHEHLMGFNSDGTGDKIKGIINLLTN